ncbi:HAMP domain-containing protein [Pseudomethylobacillus aquaticus]|uniref:histidine kinase n=1 Tax=Pseudomethylobacillus aquaticus TaxID=2676064 RepID=A0A3N0V6H9_9PROT|nr:histidine kinase [Pseudomethylobacillus aquaticus]ROH88407.1 HAMP domain-containing protein [Pseudomethylobacillus aquaticus]
MSLTVRLIVMITALLLAVMLAGAALTVNSARQDVRAEVRSTAALAIHLLDAEILHYSSDYAWLNGADPAKASIFRLRSLSNIRHVRIEFYDQYGRLRDSNRDAAERADQEKAPAWFVRLMNVGAPAEDVRRKIIVNGRWIGELVVTPDPSYEIAEVWNDTIGVLWLAGIFLLVVNAMVYWAVRFALNPVGKVVAALTEMEQGKLGARLPGFSLPELQPLSSKFNAMAATLQHSMDSNHQLTQKIINLQEDERRSLARELHDEIGQSITAINMDALAIINSKRMSAAKQSAQAISEVAMSMLDMVRTMLQRLRPGVLDELGLSIALNEQVYTWRQRNRGISSSIQIAEDINDIDEAVALAAYRVVQESLTNISRHANARRMALTVQRDASELTIRLEDDGNGFDIDTITEGYGVAGMRERVEGLGGRFNISSHQWQGTRIAVSLPCAGLA